MTDHLPECSCSRTEHTCTTNITTCRMCICPALRACEQRSYALGIEVGKHDGWISGHAAGVQAARDAVAALRGVDIRLDISRLTIDWTGEYQKFIVSADALAAIDALRGEPDE